MKNFALAVTLAIVVIFGMSGEAQNTVVGGTGSASPKYDCWYNNHVGACYRENESDHRGCVTGRNRIIGSRGSKCYPRVSQDQDIPGWHMWTISVDADEFPGAGNYSCHESDRGIDCERRKDKN
jgi:hypothetical protein